MNYRRIFAAALLPLLTLLGGCPYWPYSRTAGYYESRSNLEDLARIPIVPGETARAEILAALGRPDVAATDDRWFYYESDFLQEESGAWVYVGAGGAGAIGQWPTTQRMLFRRLYVAFRADGVVSAKAVERQECKGIGHPKLMFDDYRSAKDVLAAKQIQSCEILKRGWELRDLRLMQRLQDADGGAAHPYERFDRALWKVGRARHWNDEGLKCRTSHRLLGSLFLSNRQLVFLPGETTFAGSPPDAIRVDRTEIASLKLLETWLHFTGGAFGIEIQKRDGSFAALTFCAVDYDDAVIRKAYSRLLEGSPSNRQNP